MSLALYRRYRPETFSEVIGQEHVTEPLQQALRNNRVHHAYLFSGPRGCGKTTSARILARALNCDQGPTAQPCGNCQSCRDLARNGPGSIDVIEIDAASHGGVDDARDLRERAFFAPAAARYKIYIVDEAHMVTSAGFNALLKVVEEPPEHLKFVFATTEPEKVIGTIRSRTHHYPFRLVPPGALRDYLTEVCAAEGVSVEQGVFPLVVRAGGGSVRDALSVLDQLIGGAGADSVTYAMATALLGHTDATLLDDVVDAFAAHDGATVFEIVDRVIESGHDPRRFVTDLLERFRDLIVLVAVPDAAAKGLIDRPDDEVTRMRNQAAGFGTAELSRAADIVNAGLTEMRGATAPRLQLELICARVLLPEAAQDAEATAARLERLERRVAIGQAPSGPGAGSAVTDEPAATPARATPRVPPDAPPAPSEPPPAAPAAAQQPQATEPTPEPTLEPTPQPTPQPPAPAAQSPGAVDTVSLRRRWPEVLEAAKNRRRFTWILLSQNAHVAALAGDRLSLAFVNAGARDSFMNSGSPDIVRQAMVDVLGGDWKIECIVDPSQPPGGGDPPAPREDAGPPDRTPPDAPPSRPSARGPGNRRESRPAPSRGTRGGDPAGDGESPVESAGPAPSAPVSPEDDVPEDDDPDAPGLSGQELLARELGAQIIGEYDRRG